MEKQGDVVKQEGWSRTGRGPVQDPVQDPVPGGREHKVQRSLAKADRQGGMRVAGKLLTDGRTKASGGVEGREGGSGHVSSDNGVGDSAGRASVIEVHQSSVNNQTSANQTPGNPPQPTVGALSALGAAAGAGARPASIGKTASPSNHSDSSRGSAVKRTAKRSGLLPTNPTRRVRMATADVESEEEEVASWICSPL